MKNIGNCLCDIILSVTYSNNKRHKHVTNCKHQCLLDTNSCNKNQRQITSTAFGNVKYNNVAFLYKNDEWTPADTPVSITQLPVEPFPTEDRAGVRKMSPINADLKAFLDLTFAGLEKRDSNHAVDAKFQTIHKCIDRLPGIVSRKVNQLPGHFLSSVYQCLIWRSSNINIMCICTIINDTES